jgi:hypothetical protein
MHPIIQSKVEDILRGPMEKMLSEWEILNKQYATPIDIYNLGFDDLQNKDNTNNKNTTPTISIDETVEILDLIGEKIFKKEIARNKPELILDFIDQYWGYVEPERVKYLMNTNTYKDATAINLYQLITTNQIYPTADPYFKYNPDHPLKLFIEHGINRNLFTELEITNALTNQEINTDSYFQSLKLHNMRYVQDHQLLKNNNQKNNLSKEEYFDYNIFFGRMNSNEEIYYASLRSGITSGLGPNLEYVAKNMWEAVCKNQKILLTKSPDEHFEIFSSTELCELHDHYIENPKYKLLPNPFLNQPKYF